MKPKKLILYRLGVSRQFPATHPRKENGTHFINKIMIGLKCPDCQSDWCDACERKLDYWQKLHAIRANYSLWAKRFDKINKGEAVLELFYWSGKPYNSKQVVFATLTKDDGIGIQELEFLNGNIGDPVAWNFVKDLYLETEQLAKNDGLSLEDWKAWFKSYDLSKPLVIIHFTDFRY